MWMSFSCTGVLMYTDLYWNEMIVLSIVSLSRQAMVILIGFTASNRTQVFVKISVRKISTKIRIYFQHTCTLKQVFKSLMDFATKAKILPDCS